MGPSQLEHPHSSHVHAMVGDDHALGCYVEVSGLTTRSFTYDALSPGYDLDRPLLGALAFLVKHGFFSQKELDEALEYRQVGGRMPRSRGALLALRAVGALKAAADL